MIEYGRPDLLCTGLRCRYINGMRSIVFSDVDGTLLDSSHRISNVTLESIRSLGRRGIPFVIVSARSPSGIFPIFRRYGFRTPIIAHSGALIIDEDGKVLFHKGISKDKARSVISFMESEKMDLRNLEEGYQYMLDTFPQYKISMVHGKMKPAEKDLQMQRFAAGETQIMVATTVIEVGVNVPNASVMVIENAERFGLSQLHQLRGRVGRGAEQSYCILLTGYKLASDTRRRIDIMTRTNDGFEIAEADLRLRGPGDLDGTAQSGLPFELKIADLAQDGRLLEIARQAAMTLLEADSTLQQPAHAMLAARLRKMRNKAFNWSAIS